MNFSNVEAQFVGDNGAVIAYVIELGIIGDKQKEPMKCACTSTWVKENNNWVCTLHTEADLSQQ
ncbi:hypothetical protein [Flavobacterium sp. LB1P62]|uniref:hypothetical protein n=1 Tax=Flavobacterium sp. LB1P62 TaxID=3401715 RepID=UPI003AAC8B5C